MVKVSGGGKGMRSIKAHMDYISRNGDVVLENENGELIDGKEAVQFLVTIKELVEDPALLLLDL